MLLGEGEQEGGRGKGGDTLLHCRVYFRYTPSFLSQLSQLSANREHRPPVDYSGLLLPHFHSLHSYFNSESSMDLCCIFRFSNIEFKLAGCTQFSHALAPPPPFLSLHSRLSASILHSLSHSVLHPGLRFCSNVG